MREIKFRAFHKEKKIMASVDQLIWDGGVHVTYKVGPERPGFFFGGNNVGDDWSREEHELMQYTGKKCHNNREVYEGDILFYEEETIEGDVRYYLVVTWIEEWSMFATLFIEEYHTYLREGSKGLDEGMLWTYTLEECDTYHYAGNIHQNPELIQVKG